MGNKITKNQDEGSVRNSTLHWIPKSTNHSDKFEKLMKVEPKNLKRIGPAAVCFDNDFIIGSGSGGTCVVIGLWEDGSEVAVKRVLTSSCGKMAMNESNFVNLAESTNSRHLVRCRHFEEIDEFYYFVLDLFEETLEDYVQKQSQTKESLEDNGPVIIKELLTGLQALHCGEPEILHMDLKPRNILVDIEGHMHLTDFGISRILPEGDSKVSTETHGTNGWRAVETLSEQSNSRVKHRKRSDIQVMGMICFYILTKGKHPFGTKPHERETNQINGKAVDYGEITNPSARALISWMLEHDIEKRPYVDEALKHPYLSVVQSYIQAREAIDHMEDASSKSAMIDALNAETYLEVCRILNQDLPGRDWKTMAGKMGYSVDEVNSFSTNDSPVDAVLKDWGTVAGNDLQKLMEILTDIGRDDVAGIVKEALSICWEEQLHQTLQPAEIVRIAMEIPRIWMEVAYLTNKFHPNEIENIRYSRVNENETNKALTMLFQYNERQGTRQELARVLYELNHVTLSQNVRSGYFIDFDEN